MIVYTIVLSIAGVIIVALASIATTAIQANSRLEREKKVIFYDLESALAGKEALKDQNANLSEALEATRRIYNTLLAEHRELEVRSTALQQALEAKPTQAAKRVRKNGAQATGEQA